MKVKYLGFELSTQKSKIKISEFIENNLKFVDEDIVAREFFIDSVTHDKYFKGLVLTIKDQKTFCTLHGAAEDLQIKVENLEETDQLIEFNFFVINKNTGKGLYQFYYQSTSLMKFRDILKKQLVVYRDSLKKVEYDANIALGKSEKVSQSIANKKYHDRLCFELLVKKESLIVLLNSCQKIKNFEFEFSSYDRIQDACKPLAAIAKKIRQKVTFSEPKSVKTIAASISELISAKDPDAGSILVVDEFGQEMPYKILNTPDLFHEEEFDVLVQKLNDVKVGNFTDSNILKDMIAVCEKSLVLS